MPKANERLVPVRTPQGIADMNAVVSEQCESCAHFREGLQCAAFGGPIPSPILRGDHDHTQPFPGDRGIRFEALQDPDAPIPPLSPRERARKR